MERKEAIQQLNIEKDSLRRLAIDCGITELKPKLEAIFMAIEALKDDWIPCGEGLPELGKDVLVTDIDGDVDIMSLEELPCSQIKVWQYDFNEWVDFEDVIAWKPKPISYKGGKKEKKNDA